MIDYKQDKFEEWIKGKPFFTKANMYLDKTVVGDYKNFHVNDRWAAWCAGIRCITLGDKNEQHTT